MQNCLLWSPCQLVCCFIISTPPHPHHLPQPISPSISLATTGLLAKVKSVYENNGAGDCSNPCGSTPHSLNTPRRAFSSCLPSLMPAYKLAHVSLALRIITLKLATWDSRVQFEETNGQADALRGHRGGWGGEDPRPIRPL